MEISFLMELNTDRKTFFDKVLKKLRSSPLIIEIALSEKELRCRFKEFDLGYPDNEDDPNSVLYRSTRIPLFIELEGRRKSVLALEQLSKNLVEIDFWFFGSELDAPEWNQLGITDTQLPSFKELILEFFKTFNFIIGTVGFEVSTVDLFDTNKTWPNKEYDLNNIKTSNLLDSDYFMKIIVNKNFINLKSYDKVLIQGNAQIIEKNSA